MQSHRQPTVLSWHQTILKNILARYQVTLNQAQLNQIHIIYDVIGRFSPTSLDYLEIFRIFNIALSQWQAIKINEKRLTITDLFYASVFVGLKSYNESHQYAMRLSEIVYILPPNSDYYGKLKEAAVIEIALLKGLDWQIHESQENQFNAYDLLLRCLSRELLHQFATSIVLIAAIGAGDSDYMLTMLSERLNVNLNAKVERILSEINKIPLRESFSYNNYVMANLGRDVNKFINNENLTEFSISDETMESICCAIYDYFKYSPKLIQISQANLLSYYFDNKVVSFLLELSCERIMKGLSVDSEWINSIQYQCLLSAINNHYVDFEWLLQILGVLEMLKADKALNGGMLALIFDDFNCSVSILRHFQDLYREGWLRVINNNEHLIKMVYQHVKRSHALSDLTPYFAEVMAVYFTMNLPSMKELKFLHRWSNSQLSKSLSAELNWLKLQYYIACLLPRISTKSHDEHILKNLENYFLEHFDDQIHLLLGLESINDELSSKDSSLMIELLSNPSLLPFRANLMINLIVTFYSLELKNLGRLLRREFQEILNYSVDARSCLTIANRSDCAKHVTYRKGITVYESIDLFKHKIRQMIEANIQNGLLCLSTDDLDKLNRFYKAYRMDVSMATQTSALCIRLFSQKCATAYHLPNRQPMGVKRLHSRI